MGKWLVIAIIIVAVLLAGGCIGTGSPAPAGKLAVINHDMNKEESGSVKVEVTVKNVGSVVVGLAQVTVNFYGADNNFIDSASDAVMNLGPGEIWDFEIACESARCSQVKTYEIETMAGTSTGG